MVCFVVISKVVRMLARSIDGIREVEKVVCRRIISCISGNLSESFVVGDSMVSYGIEYTSSPQLKLPEIRNYI